MSPETTLALAGALHEGVRAHLYPGDGLEAAAILVCARTPGPRLRLLARDAVLIPYSECVRSETAITWPGGYIEQAIDRADAEQLALILIHSHPGGLFAFSDVDDASDGQAIPGLFQAHGDLHGSAIMTPDGAIRARLYSPNLSRRPIDLVTVAGHDLSYWWGAQARLYGPSRRPMAFTGAMTAQLGRLSAVVIGVSGTGSIVAEQVARLGFGRVILIDFDWVERRNLNRILNATLSDAENRRLKVGMFADAITAHRGPGVAEAVDASVVTRKAVLAASQGDVIFSCVDTLEARQIADLIAAAFLIPLFDVGVVIPVRKDGEGVAIADVCGRIDYVQPGASTLQDRGVYSPDTLRAEYLRRSAPEAHQQEVEAGYIKGLIEEAPAVITLNMRAAAASVNEFVARAFPYRQEPNQLYARTEFSLAACEEDFTAEDAFPVAPNPMLGRGALEPLLGLPALAPVRNGHSR
jgi:hypothetical protein